MAYVTDMPNTTAPPTSQEKLDNPMKPARPFGEHAVFVMRHMLSFNKLENLERSPDSTEARTPTQDRKAAETLAEIALTRWLIPILKRTGGHHEASLLEQAQGWEAKYRQVTDMIVPTWTPESKYSPVPELINTIWHLATFTNIMENPDPRHPYNMEYLAESIAEAGNITAKIHRMEKLEDFDLRTEFKNALKEAGIKH